MDKLEYKILLTEGDSWTSGDIIDPSLENELNGHVNSIKNDNFRLPKVWPSKLGKHLGLKVINQAIAGSSNDGIVRRTVNSVIGLLKEHNPEDILVVIGFSSPERKDFIIEKRSRQNYGVCLAGMLLSTSLAKQDHGWDYLEKNSQTNHPLPIYYCVGSEDQKFNALAEKLSSFRNMNIVQFNGAGHNIHQQQPLPYAQFIIDNITH